MKNILLLVFMLCVVHVFGQRVDTVISNEVFKSYFSYAMHQPLYVVYKLYKGGGDCNRSKFHFTTGGLLNSAHPSDYAHSGYDEGHLCNAEDEAFNCDRDKMTFHFYNCVPQTKKLNRGIWKVWETAIREESQSDSLLIICGSIFGSKMIGHISVPDKCWKVVFSLTTHRVIYCLMFPNDTSDLVEAISVNDLKKRVPYKIRY